MQHLKNNRCPPPSQITMKSSPIHYRAHVSLESSFVHSLASIHKDTPLSRRASFGEGLRSESKPRRRASVSGAPVALQGAASQHRSSTPQGILRTHEDASTAASPSQHRVSFAHQPDGTISRRVSNYDEHASPKQSLPRSSVKDSLPPLPLRPSRSANTDKSLAARFPKGTSVPLPFPTTPVATPRPVLRSGSILGPDKDERSVSPSSVFPSLPFSRTTQARQGNSQAVCASRCDYRLGEPARSSSHMVIDSNPSSAASKVSTLKNYDFAFIKRTDGLWTYAILAYRTEESMMFVMNETGSTKIIKKRQWAEYVRCVAALEENATQ